MRIFPFILVFTAFFVGCKKKNNQINPQNQCLTPTEVKIQYVSGQEVSFELVGTDSTSIGKVSWTIISDEKTLQIETNGKTHVTGHFSKSGEFRVTAVIETVCKTKNTLTRSENIQIEQYTRQWITDIGLSLDTTLWVLAESPNGGCVAVGSAGSQKIVSIDSEGNILWKKDLAGSNYEKIRSIVNADDGGYILGGDWLGTEYRYGITKISATGEKLWDKTYKGIGNPYSEQTYDRLVKVINAQDGGYILAGYSSSLKGADKSESPKNADAPRNYTLTDYWIIKIDTQGNKVWDKTIGGKEPESLSNIIETTDGGYLISGLSYSQISGDKTKDSDGLYDSWLVKINKGGTIEWDRSTPYTPGWGSEIAGLFDGSIIIIGQPGKGKIEYTKLNSLGNNVWDKEVQGNYTSILPSNEGGFIMVGSLDQYNLITFSNDGIIKQRKIIDLGKGRFSPWDKATKSKSGGYYGFSYFEGSQNVFFVK